MSLSKINFDNSDNIKKKISTLDDIKKIIYDTTKVSVSIKNYEPPKIILTVDNGPAASEINLNSITLIDKLSKDYGIEKLVIKIN